MEMDMDAITQSSALNLVSLTQLQMEIRRLPVFAPAYIHSVLLSKYLR